jgi:hypothetical protein
VLPKRWRCTVTSYIDHNRAVVSDITYKKPIDVPQGRGCQHKVKFRDCMCVDANTSGMVEDWAVESRGAVCAVRLRIELLQLTLRTLDGMEHSDGATSVR